MSIASVAAASTAANASAVTDQKSIADNFDIFLKLLTTQLKNQNPLEPLKTSEFTQQMVQFTQVEQQVKANKNLERLGELFLQTTLTSSVSYIGKTVTAEADTTNLENGNATWDIEFDQKPEDSSIIITDRFGKVVFSEKPDFNNGMNSFSWNGRNGAGQPQPDGLYTIKINAINDSGEAIASSTLISGVVTGVDMTSDTGVLNLGSRSVRIDNVRKIAA